MKFFKKIYQGYCYLFYVDYLWLSKPYMCWNWGNPAITATYFLATIMGYNIVSLMILDQLLFGKDNLLYQIFFKNELQFFIAVALPVLFFHNFIFLRKKKYKKIISYYEKHPINMTLGKIIHWGYVVGSIAFFGNLILFIGVYFTRNNLIPLVEHIHEINKII